MIFPNFPHSQFPSTDERLNAIVRNHGGWLLLLDPTTDLDLIPGLALALLDAGYSGDEISALKALFAPGKREQVLLQTAVLRRKASLGLCNEVDLQNLENLEKSLSTQQISTEELKDAMDRLAPYVVKWFS